MESRPIFTRADLVEAFKELDQVLANEGRLMLKFEVDTRSIPQNNLFHKWCGEMAEALTAKGYNLVPEDDPKQKPKYVVKTWMKAKFLGVRNIRYGNKYIPDQLIETSSLDVGPMYQFMEQVWHYAASEYQIYLTIPSDSQFKKNRDKQND